MHLAETLEDYIYPVFEILVVLLNVVSVLILVIGMVKVTHRYIMERSQIKSADRKGKTRAITRMRTQLGTYIMLSLEILIITDIVESIMEPSTEFLIRLVLVVVIRTTLSFFLQKEIQHEQHELKELEDAKEAEEAL